MAKAASVSDRPEPGAPAPHNGIMGISGMAAKSWNSRMEKAARPWRVVSSLFSSST